MAITYYACARNEDNIICQLLVSVSGGSTVSVYTGKTYKTDKDAANDLERLNRKEVAK